jgi:hypothetical protein
MAIILSITSDVAMPIAQADLPQNVTITPVATDSSDPVATFTYSYFIVDKPPTSTATLTNATGANTVLNADVWGSYRVFVIATNNVSAETSEDNPVAAPASAFYDVRVISTNRELEKPAKSQRNWFGQYWDLVDAVEGLNANKATLTVGGASEIASIVEIAQGAGKNDSDSDHELVMTPDRLATVLGSNNAGGNLVGGQINNLRDSVKSVALEKINESSITQLSDVDTVSSTPTDGQVLTWDSSHTDDQGGTGAWIPTTLSVNEGDITAVIAGSGLSGGGTSGDVTLVAFDINTSHIADDALIDSSEAFSDVDDKLMTAAAIKDLIDANVGGSASVGDQYDIQVADGSGGFSAANWQIGATHHLIPITNNVYDVGSSTKRARTVYAYDLSVSDDITLGDRLSISTGGEIHIGSSGLSSISLNNNNADTGTMLFKTLGSNDAGLNSVIRNEADDVQFAASSTATEAKATLVGTAANVSFVTQSKMTSSHSIGVPSNAATAAVGDVAYVTDNSSGIATTDYATPTSRIAYSTHVSREVTEEASFSAGNLVFSGDEQACIYWVKNTTGQDIELRNTHIHVGEMRNISLAFAVVKATSDANALSNTWTQVSSSFTLTNSSGADNVLGQATATDTTNHTFASGDYIGLVCTSIPATNRNDKRISITFDCRTAVEML